MGTKLYEALVSGEVVTSEVPVDGQFCVPPEVAAEAEAWCAPFKRLDDGSIFLRLVNYPWSWSETEREPPEGVVSKRVNYADDDDDEPFWSNEWTLPVLGPTFYVRSLKDGIILDLKGQRFKITKVPQEETPLKGNQPFLLLTPTTGPVSEMDVPPPKEGYFSGNVQVFGQPRCQQGDAFPEHDGRAAYLLYLYPTYTGDSGLENVFIGFDEDGNPCRAWTSYSSC